MNFNELFDKVAFIYKAMPVDHDDQHILRVIKYATIIAKTEPSTKTQILLPAAILHDIGRLVPKTNHAESSATMAKPIIHTYWPLPPKEEEETLYAIRVHNKIDKPETLEAQILQDADKLDGLGVLGLSRIIYSSGRRGSALFDPENPFGEDQSLDNLIKKVESSPIAPRSERANKFTIEMILTQMVQYVNFFWTAKGRELAEPKLKFTKDFLRTFEKELNGND